MNVQTETNTSNGHHRSGVSTETKLTKSEFVRQQDIELPPAEVVERAKAKGMTITPALVHTVRWQERKRGGAKKQKRIAAASAKKSASKKPSKKQVRVHAHAQEIGLGKLTQEEQSFLVHAMDLGLARSASLLAQYRRQVMTFIGG